MYIKNYVSMIYNIVVHIKNLYTLYLYVIITYYNYLNRYHYYVCNNMPIPSQH